MSNTNLKQDINTALNNDNLKGALGRFGEAYPIAREKAYEGKDFEVIREQIAKAKSYAAENMEN
ncbi:hypothetical protein N752_08915 [Desulforamulus aquiferis]|nr:hypothetical protein N752_08915 [Desulforamulus aquiferis]